jgi:hypothetical protein
MCIKCFKLGIYYNNLLFIYYQDQTSGDLVECDSDSDIPPPNFQLIKTEVLNDKETETVTDVTENDELENTDTSKNDSENIHFEDIIEATT